MKAASSLSTACLQERVGTVEKQKNDLMMQQAMMQQQGESSHMMQGSMLGTPFGPGESAGWCHVGDRLHRQLCLRHLIG